MSKTIACAFFAGSLLAQRPITSGQINSVSGNGNTTVTTTGPQTAGNCVTIDNNGNHVASGVGCGTGTGTAVTASSIFSALGYTPVNPSTLAAVALSGSYLDLTAKPATNNLPSTGSGALCYDAPTQTFSFGCASGAPSYLNGLLDQWKMAEGTGTSYADIITPAKAMLALAMDGF